MCVGCGCGYVGVWVWGEGVAGSRGSRGMQGTDKRGRGKEEGQGKTKVMGSREQGLADRPMQTQCVCLVWGEGRGCLAMKDTRTCRVEQIGGENNTQNKTQTPHNTKVKGPSAHQGSSWRSTRRGRGGNSRQTGSERGPTDATTAPPRGPPTTGWCQGDLVVHICGGCGGLWAAQRAPWGALGGFEKPVSATSPFLHRLHAFTPVPRQTSSLPALPSPFLLQNL